MNKEMSELTRRLASVVVPLRKAEERGAIKATQAHLGKELSDHFRIFGAELQIEKPPKAGALPSRMVGVLVVDYGKRRNLIALVDANGKVVKVDDLRGAQPAYMPEEIDEAREIAEQERRVASIAKTKGSFVSEFGPEHAADNARLIGLRYAVVGKHGVGQVLAHAIVDLSARKLVRFDEAPADARPGMSGR